ncbi:MAG: HAD-IB family hydrolase [Halofilum sp. (in: g-proteobacteria)]|nr:HAD-IB family hydrolase [Halofilum sp. (in: g-proteobacteria)]
MPLAIFDLDHTLLADDSDHLWGQYLAEHGVVDGEHYLRENDRYMADYKAGRLDIDAFLRFSLRVLGEHEPAELARLRAGFVEEKIVPVVAPGAPGLLARHREAGDHLMIITATNRFVTEPIAQMLGVETLLATEAEMRDGRYTGLPTGTPCFREGKVTRLEAWLADNGADLAGASFYSDSHNDLPLLERVERPVAVDPDPQLAQAAAEREWPRDQPARRRLDRPPCRCPGAVHAYPRPRRRARRGRRREGSPVARAAVCPGARAPTPVPRAGARGRCAQIAADRRATRALAPDGARQPRIRATGQRQPRDSGSRLRGLRPGERRAGCPTPDMLPRLLRVPWRSLRDPRARRRRSPIPGAGAGTAMPREPSWRAWRLGESTGARPGRTAGVDPCPRTQGPVRAQRQFSRR